MRSLRPILPNGQELPDVPEAVAVGIVVRPDSSSNQMSVVARFPDGTEYNLDELPEDFESLNQSHFPASPSALREDVLTTEYDCEPRQLSTVSPEDAPNSAFGRASSSAKFSAGSTRTTANIVNKCGIDDYFLIIRHLLHLVSGNHSARLITDRQNIYKSLIQEQTLEIVSLCLQDALEPEIADLYKACRLDWKSLSGLDKEKPGHYVWPGVYLHVIFDPNYPGVFCLYIGASMNVASRVEEHKKFRFTPSRDCLHYRIWNRPGRQDFFVLLGGIGNEPYRTQQQIILINLLEEVSCLMWQTLPSSVLRKALPDAISIFQPDIHLNRASPLRQIYNLGPPRKDNLDAAEEFTQGSLDLATSEDPEIRDYLEMRDRFKLLPSWRHAEGGRLSHVTHRKSQYKTMMLSQRQARPAQTAFLRRDPEISLGDRPDVLIQCKRCQHPDTRRFDPAPQYEISTGRYILRKTSCTKCCEIFGISNKYGISLPGFTETVDPSIPSVPITSLEYAARTGKERP